MKKLRLSNGSVTLLDNEDFELVKNMIWHEATNGYAVNTSTKFTTIYLHRLVTKAIKGDITDHINGNKLDNRKKNLRLCGTEGNARNRGKGKGLTSSVFKGVSWHPTQKQWRARVKIDGSEVMIGFFSNERSAARAYNKLASKLFGEFARLNKLRKTKKV